MPSLHPILAIALLPMCALSAFGQSPVSVSVPISVRVAPSLEIGGLLPAAARVDSPTRLTVARTVAVQSSLPYRLAVRLANGSERRTPDGIRVLVGRAGGDFVALAPHEWVNVAMGQLSGRRSHEIVCRVDAPTPHYLDAARCTLVVELVAEHGDGLLRTTAAVSSSNPPLPTTEPPQ
jgi:hypothetical protein